MRQGGGLEGRRDGQHLSRWAVALAAVACGGRGADAAGAWGSAQGDTQHAPALEAQASCEGLLDGFRTDLLDEVSARAERARASGAELGALAQAHRSAALEREPEAPRTGDLTAVDGERLYALHAGQLFVLPARPAGALELLGAIAIEGEPRQLFVHAGQVLVLSWFAGAMPGQSSSPDAVHAPTYVKWTLVDARGERPEIIRESYVEGASYQPGVQHGSAVSVVLQHAVNAPLDHPIVQYMDTFGRPYDADEIEQQIQLWVELSADAIAASTLADYLPWRLERSQGELVLQPFACDGYFVSPGGASTSSFSSVVRFDFAAPFEPLGGLTVLEPMQGAYLGGDVVLMSAEDPAGSGDPMNAQTQLHRFVLDGQGPRYSASGSIEGALPGDGVLDERNGVIRAATTRYVAVPPANEGDALRYDALSRIVTLTVRDDRLIELGRSPDFARGELILGTRLLAERAYVPTSGGSDPALVVLDLSHPRAPELGGRVPLGRGTRQLLPLPEGGLLAVGMIPDEEVFYREHVALQLLDVADAATPRLRHELVFRNAGAWPVTEDLRSLALDAERGIIAFPWRDFDSSVSTTEVIRFSADAGFSHAGSVVPAPVPPPLDECLASLGYPTDPQAWDALGLTPEVLESLLRACTDFRGPPVRRAVLGEDTVFTITTRGVLVHPLEQPSAPPVHVLELPESAWPAY